MKVKNLKNDAHTILIVTLRDRTLVNNIINLDDNPNERGVNKKLLKI